MLALMKPGRDLNQNVGACGTTLSVSSSLHSCVGSIFTLLVLDPDLAPEPDMDGPDGFDVVSI